MKRVLVLCTTDSMIWNFLIPHIIHMQDNGIFVECACSKTGIYMDELIYKYNFHVYNIPFHRTPYSIENIYAYKQLIDLIYQKNYDTIFCHEPVGGVMGRIAGHTAKKMVIYMAHGFHFYKGAPKINWLIYYNIEKYLSRYTDLLITINKEDYQIAQKFKSKRVVLINGIGINLTQFKKFKSKYFCENFKLKEDDFSLLSVGELIPRKNHEIIINAVAELKNPKIHLFIAGEGKLKDYLKKIIHSKKLEKNVHLLGFCRNISELCNACNVFIFPSIQEGLSMALMEAMACGKPIIASKIRGNVDLIENNKGGYLISSNDKIAYKNAIISLYEQPYKCTKFGKYNLIKIQNYSIENVIKQMDSFLFKI